MVNMTEELGKYFGYPICCIQAYIDVLENAGRKTPEQYYINQISGDGFIPCPNHAKQIISGQITLESLIQNRVCILPFPQEPPMEEIDHYIFGKDAIGD